MASPDTNGGESSLAEKMRQQHAEVPRPTVEDAPEDDAADFAGPSAGNAGGSSASWGRPASSIAPSKQKSTAGPDVTLDTQSHELFPELGAPKSKANMGAVPTWAAKGPSNKPVNGGSQVNGSSRVSAPATTRAAVPAMTIPGRNVESITIHPQHILPREKLRRPIPDIIKDINRKSRANIAMVPLGNGKLKFDATGPQDVAQQALKDLVQQIGVKTTVSVSIPQSARAHIIGKQGSTIKALQERTGARIMFPKIGENQPNLDDDDDTEILVTIEGNTISAASACDEIRRIANERAANTSTKLRGIPAELYPFIAGPGNEHVSALEESNGVQIRVPPHRFLSSQPVPVAPAPGQLPMFVAASDDNYIQLAGPRESVQKARAEIERKVAELQQQLQMEQFTVERGRHQFIIGDRGIPMDDFFTETKCSIILPADEENDVVTIIGPGAFVPGAMDRAIDLAMGMQCSVMDIARIHRDAPGGAAAHARNVTRYLQQRREIERLEKLYNAHIATPFSKEGGSNWQLYSRDGQSAVRARSEITNIVNGHPPSRMAALPVDPFFHQHIRNNIRPRVREDYGVHVVVPEASDSAADILLVYEAPAAEDTAYKVPQTHPSREDIQLFQQGLLDARKHILELINKQEQIISEAIDVPQKFHDRLRRFIKREQESRSDDQIPVRVSALGTVVTLRGPASAVNSLASKVNKFIEQEKEDEKERGFTMSFEFPQKFANHLIGKGGSNIRELRDRFDVEIQVQDGKVELKGPKAKAEAAKAHILSMGRTLADETTHTLKIDPKFHRELIGAQGGQINKLQTRYKVLIFFPRTGKSGGDEQSNADAASESGKPRRQQAADEVTIRGPKKGADEARDEIFSLYQYLKDNSHTATVTVQQKQIPSLIGQGGAALEDLRQATGAKIDIPAARDTETVEVQLKGTKSQVAAAKKALEEKKSVFNDTVVKMIEVDRKHHKALIGAGGANLRELVVGAGGSDDRRELSRTIQFPKQDTDGNTIKVEGRSDIVQKVVDAIQKKVEEWDSQTAEVIDVPMDKHKALIGRGGDIKRQLEAQFKVSLDIPRQGEGKTGVKITGQKENVEKAKEHVQTLIKEKHGETVQVPRTMHHSVSNGGQFFRTLRNDYGVTVDHAGQSLPQRPQASRANGGQLPLITDDADAAADAHSWSTVQNSSGEEGDIPWVLRGSAENVEKAKKAIQAALEQGHKSDTTGYLVLPDPRMYRHIIGPSGSKVKSIRQQSGCRINVPRDQARDEAIEIIGTKEGVEKAKELILAAVREGANKARE